MSMTNEKLEISAHEGALALIDMAYEMGLVNKPTYQKIQEKYNNGNKPVAKTAKLLYNADKKLGEFEREVYADG